MIFVQGQQWQLVFQAYSSNQHIFDPYILVAADQLIMKARCSTSRCNVQWQGMHSTQQCILTDLATRTRYAKKQLISRDHRDKAVQFLHGALDCGRTWVATFEKSDQWPGI